MELEFEKLLYLANFNLREISMGIKLWKKREDLVDNLINQRNLKCSCPSYNICTCEVKINKFLKDINYFQLFNGLENILLSSNSPKDFGNVVSVEDFKRIYFFDRKLANEIFNLTNIFEEKLQNSISYYFSEAYCSSLNDTMQYTNKLNYKDISTYVNYPFSRSGQLYNSIIYNFNATDHRGNPKFKLFNSKFLDKLVNNNDMINESFYRDNNYNASSGVSVYSNDCKVAVPFWVAIQTFDFGTLKYLCHYLKDSEMNLVLNDFGLHRNQRNMFLSILDIINELRNYCAHGKLIFKFRTPEFIKINNNVVSRYGLNVAHGTGTRTTPYSVINLFDTLMILSDFVSVKSVYKIFKKLIYLNNRSLKKDAGRINDNILRAINVSSYSDLKRLC